MELRHVRIFLTLAEELHFGRAATRMRIAQSAVSQAIRALEEEVGVVLFDRTRRRVALSAAGERFVEHAKRAVGELDAAREAARSIGAGESGTLRLRFTMASALTILPRTVTRFQQTYPNVALSIEAGGSALDPLRAGQCDLAFGPKGGAPAAATATGAADDLLESLIVERHNLVALVSRDHRLAKAKAKKVRLAELAKDPFVFLKRTDEPRIDMLFRKQCERAGFEPNVVLEVSQIEMLFGFVGAGLGVSCIPSHVMKLGFPDVVGIPLHPEVEGGIRAFWRADHLSPTAARFLEILRDQLKASKSTHHKS